MKFTTKKNQLESNKTNLLNKNSFHSCFQVNLSKLLSQECLSKVFDLREIV